jgi:hypothetical protein
MGRASTEEQEEAEEGFVIIPVRHRVCSGVAFYYDHVPEMHERIEGRHAVPPRDEGSPIICEACGCTVHAKELLYPLL